VGRTAKVAPVPQAIRPFQAGWLGPQAVSSIERYTDGIKGRAALKLNLNTTLGDKKRRLRQVNKNRKV
jgi:hypothetical protein